MKRQDVWSLAVGAAIVVALLGFAHYAHSVQPRPATSTSTTTLSAEVLADKAKWDHIRLRLWLYDRREDDQLRYASFAQLLGKHWRCDYVTSALMSTDGTWRVRCAPGYGYRLAFDNNLNLIDIGKDP